MAIDNNRKTLNMVYKELGLPKKYLIRTLQNAGRNIPDSFFVPMPEDDYSFLMNTLKEEGAALKARKIAKKYSNSFKFIFRKYSSYVTDYQRAQEIIEKESFLEEKEDLFQRINCSISDWERLCQIPYYYFYNYYPKSRFKPEVLTETSIQAREMICQFLSGNYSSFMPLFIEKLKTTFIIEDLSRLSLVCNPAPTSFLNTKRYRNFSFDAYLDLGIEDCFEHIIVEKDEIPISMGGTEEEVQYKIDKDFFRGKYVLLFDGLITKSKSLIRIIDLLEDSGAIIICIMSIGRTIPLFLEGQSIVHPWTNNT